MSSYRDEIDEIADRDDDLARIVPSIGEAEAQAAGVRSHDFLAEYGPATPSAGGASQRMGGPPCSPPKSSQDHESPIAGGVYKPDARPGRASAAECGVATHGPANTPLPDDAGPSQPALSPPDASCPDRRRGDDGSDRKEAA